MNRDGDTITPGENLIAEGIPPIPESLAEDAGRYTEFRQAYFADWHPARREMLIRTRFGDTDQVHRVRNPGGARCQLTFFRDAVAGASFEPDDGRYFVFSKGSGGNEFYQHFRFDLESGAITLLTDGTSRNTGGVWSNRGDRRAYESTRRNGKDTDLYVIDPTDPESDRLVLQVDGGGWSVLDWSPDDRALLVEEYLSISRSRLWLVDIETGAMRRIAPDGDEEVHYRGGVFRRDGKGIYTATDRDSEFLWLTAVDLVTGAHTCLTPDIPWDVDEYDLARDGRTIAFVANEEGIGVLHLLDAASEKERPVPAIPEGSVAGVRWRRNGRDLAFHLHSARAPMDVYSLDVETGAVDRWTESETGGIDVGRLAEPEIVRWRSFDGRAISGFLYRPPARFTGKHPVAIVIHGGPESQFRPMYLGQRNYLLDELGVVLLFPNVRGSTGFGKTFHRLDNGFLREGSYRDVEALFDWIGTQPDLDAGRVMVMGGSYGGHMVLAAATRYPGRIRCAVDIVGISNLATFLERTEVYRRNLRRAEYGDERDPTMREFLERIAPLNRVDRIVKPLFVIQGANDPRVPLSESEQIVAALRGKGVPVWYLVAKDEGHGFIKKRNVDYQFYATVTFMKRYLL